MFPEVVSQDGASWQQVKAAQPVGGTAGPERGLGSALPACLTAVVTCCRRDPHAERNGVQAAAPGHRVLRGGHHGRDPAPREGVLLAGEGASAPQTLFTLGFLSELFAKTIP